MRIRLKFIFSLARTKSLFYVYLWIHDFHLPTFLLQRADVNVVPLEDYTTTRVWNISYLGHKCSSRGGGNTKKLDV